MTHFTGFGQKNGIDFGDYVEIEQLRHGSPNEMYIHKVIGAFESNTWVNVPIKWDSKEVRHNRMEKVLNVICCGVDETKVFRVREVDCSKVIKTPVLDRNDNLSDIIHCRTPEMAEDIFRFLLSKGYAVGQSTVEITTGTHGHHTVKRLDVLSK